MNEVTYKAEKQVTEQASQKAEARAKSPKAKRKSRERLMLEAAARNKAERKAGKPQTIEIYC